MITGPLIAEIAALVGEPARATMLSALLDGRALTASELAFCGEDYTPNRQHASPKADRGRITVCDPGRTASLFPACIIKSRRDD
jgi:hypothetical protein